MILGGIARCRCTRRTAGAANCSADCGRSLGSARIGLVGAALSVLAHGLVAAGVTVSGIGLMLHAG
ncbi:hypothetical protein [Streptomyces sp. NPDC016845]|uniref:hypothetical protein n=1 Tax=Streptomyces sp. NPDC016845 TaxID=3364972 RepID=UPI0037AECB4C